MSKKNEDVSRDLQDDFKTQLGTALEKAESEFAKPGSEKFNVTDRMRDALEYISKQSEKASTGFTNIMTALAIKATLPKVDVRYHQVQIQKDTKRPAGFNFRSVSEKLIYPWLAQNTFEGAKSGWQTRTFERPKPYFLDYAENIGDIKEPFLAIYDELENDQNSAFDALAYILLLQVHLRETKKIQIAQPSTDDILLIVTLFTNHFFHPYKGSKGASRLPVLAFYSIYVIMLEELSRYKGMTLKPLESHSAADSQTGAVGDIEVALQDGSIFEGIEIKHGLEIDDKIIQDVKSKIMDKTLNRYYVLTTHKNCEPTAKIKTELEQIQLRFKCQVIVNGVIPSLRYYLRMLSNPSKVFAIYTKLLLEDKSIAHEHREAWNKIVTT